MYYHFQPKIEYIFFLMEKLHMIVVFKVYYLTISIMMLARFLFITLFSPKRPLRTLLKIILDLEFHSIMVSYPHAALCNSFSSSETIFNAVQAEIGSYGPWKCRYLFVDNCVQKCNYVLLTIFAAPKNDGHLATAYLSFQTPTPLAAK